MDLCHCLLLFMSVYLVSIEALMFHISPNQKKCLKEEIHKDVLVTGDYELSEAHGQVTVLKVGLQSWVNCNLFYVPVNMF